MGNYYYVVYTSRKGDESQLKLCYKYIHPVLTEHVRNFCAANALGIVCANKNETAAAKDIFDKVFELLLNNCYTSMPRMLT